MTDTNCELFLVALLDCPEYEKLKLMDMKIHALKDLFSWVMQYPTATRKQLLNRRVKIWCVATGGVFNKPQLYLMPDGLCGREAYATRIDVQVLSSGRGTIP